MLGLSIRISCKVENTQSAMDTIERIFSATKYRTETSMAEFEISLVELGEPVPYLGPPISQGPLTAEDWTNGKEEVDESKG